MSRTQSCHPLDPLSAAEISVAVATVRAAGATPEVNYAMKCSIKRYICIFIQIIKIESMYFEQLSLMILFPSIVFISYSSETVSALLK